MQGPPGHGGGPSRDHDVAHEAPESPFYRSLGAWVLKWRTLVLVGNVAVSLIALVVIATGLEVHNNIEQFLDYDSEARAMHERLRESFGDDQTFVVLVEGDVFSMPYLERLRALHHDLEGLDITLTHQAPLDGAAMLGFDDLDAADDGWGDAGGGSLADEVVSVINVRDTRWEDGALHVAGLLDRWPRAEDLPGLRERVQGAHRPAGDLVSADGRYSILVLRSVTLADADLQSAYELISATANSYEEPGFQVSVGGPFGLYGALNGLTLWDLLRVGAATTVVMLGAMFVLFRKPIRAFAPVSALGNAVIWSVALQVLLGIPLTLVTMVLLPLLMCVGIGAVVHVQEVFLESRENGLPHREALLGAVASTGLPVFHTATTTAAGMFSFMLADIPPIRDLGLLAGVGVMASFVQTMVWLPALLTLDPGDPSGPRRSDSVLARVAMAGDRASRSLAGRNRVLLAGLLVLAVSVWGMTSLRITTDSLNFLPHHHEVRRTFAEVDRHIAGTNTISVLLEADDVRDLDVLRGLERVERDLLAYRTRDGAAIVTGTNGLLSLLREGWRALHEDQDAFYALPDTQRAVFDTFTLLEAGGADHLARFVTLDGHRSLMTLQVQWRDSAQYLPLVDHLEASIAEHLPGVVARPTGSVMSHVSVENAVTAGQFQSFLGACAMVIVLLVLLVGDVGLGILAIVPNLLPIAMILGVMGATGIFVDVQNVLISSLVVGVAVDDTVHLLHQFNTYRLRYGDRDEAIAFAFRHAGRPSISTGIILAAGFGSFVVSAMPATRGFGLLVATAVLFGLVVELLFTPALLRLVYPKTIRPRATERSGALEVGHS